MPFMQTPGVIIQEQPAPRTVAPVGTSTAAFLGPAPDAKAHPNEAFAVNNWSEFRNHYAADNKMPSTVLANAVYGFFANRGSRCYIVNMPKSEAIRGGDQPRTGLKLLEEIDEVAIVAAPGIVDPASHEDLIAHCEKMGDRVCILDPPLDVPNTDLLKTVEAPPLPAPPKGKDKTAAAPDDGGTKPAASAAPPPPAGLHPRLTELGFATMYFPWIVVRDALDPAGALIEQPPSGHIAGVWAKNDALYGVHSAPAGQRNPIAGCLNLTYRVTGEEQGELNTRGINCIRFFAQEGPMIWGCRTLADPSSKFRYLNARRLFNFIEKSILRSNMWVVFQPNDRPLWKLIRSEITGFLLMCYRDGALVGKTPEEAFFVKCDEETNPQESIDMGYVRTVIGIRPVLPAEFVIFQIGFHEEGATVEVAK